MPLKQTVVVTEHHHASLTRAELVNILRGWFRTSDDVEVFVTVPGGGDWSNTDVNIDADTHLQLRWTTRRSETVDAEGNASWQALKE